ncbi:uncharacterized protein LOC135463405 [Liolophura sinensis]|uniref:uncharacterized protein LOC135463405 n=1 Tax=Liolophura sinensis TaxID=3198878 RepID=UPI0031597D84
MRKRGNLTQGRDRVPPPVLTTTTRNAEGDQSKQQKGSSAKKKPWYRRLTTLAKIIFVLLIVPPFLNYAALQKEMAELMPEGQLYDVGWGQKLFMSCKGKGTPTVILDAPTGMTSDVWSLAVPLIAKVTKVCVYDRAGLGFSERPRRNMSSPDMPEDTQAADQNFRDKMVPFSAETMVEDFTVLFTQASQQEVPFILVGAEIGAIVAEFYTQLYEGNVAGLVLINPLSEDIFKQQNSVWSQFWFGHLLPSFQSLQLGAAVGLTRIALLLGLVHQPLQLADLPEEIVNRQKHLLCHPRHMSSVVDEHHFINETFDQLRLVRRMKQFPGNISVMIMTGNYYDEQLPSQLNKAWAKSEQNLISQRFPNAQQIVINGADHHMLYRKPLAVAEPINRMVRLYRQKHRPVKAPILTEKIKTS